jgi:hypothetical protein
MAGIARVYSVLLFSIVLFAGCSRNASPDSAATPSNGSQPAPQAAQAPQIDAALQPIANAAADFLDAVLKGDTQRGSARLTPKAMQRIVETGKQFDPPGIENPSFRIIDVRTPSDDHAFVQCTLTYSANGAVRTEDMCCELRRVENDWRVSGIAYETSPDKPFTLYDFETDRDISISRQPAPAASANTSPADSAGGRASPSPTAQQLPATAPVIERR